ncbi:RtcB family protein [Streptomyces sp. DSM 41972]|uniref:3'-phosphate/5'-hydroxy nucleic acid ligase n=1 Tax=Streptomyces althioticus subsp. attaecolombicae TaxID=3075534 RepID=A0ABU3HUK4_9ACTN|nr:RtcB family protein [Streptomyces sp. DSM 41972]SCD76474.1 tRNA-splicing ligase RtcB [Streptomyces sp. di50b]SCD86616.1 tRNA-splicing ligase RtcB [Streptomyces sp. di188]
MSYVELPGAKVPVRMWADPATVEEGALQQLRDVAALPWIEGLAVMPDVHYGRGATVGSYIVKGLGNAASFNSASHGAGRRMSRIAAKRRFTAKDLAERTQGVECRRDSGAVDEIPSAYKPIEQVIDQQRDLVEVVAKLKQAVCVKG